MNVKGAGVALRQVPPKEEDRSLYWYWKRRALEAEATLENMARLGYFEKHSMCDFERVKLPNGNYELKPINERPITAEDIPDLWIIDPDDTELTEEDKRLMNEVAARYLEK